MTDTTLPTLAQRLQQAQNAGQLRLDATTLGTGSAAIINLFQQTLFQDSITLTGALSITLSTDAYTLVVSGTAAQEFYNVGNMAIVCTLSIGTDTNLLLTMYMTPPAAAKWTFPISFPELEYTFFQRLSYTTPIFLLSTHNYHDSSLQIDVHTGSGLYIQPTKLDGPLAPVSSLAEEVANLSVLPPFYGPLLENSSARKLSLLMPFPKVQLPIAGLPTISIHQAALVLNGSYIVEPESVVTTMAVQGDVQLGGVTLPFFIQLPSDSSWWQFGLIPGQRIPLSDIPAFLGDIIGVDLSSNLPSDITALAGFSLDTFFVIFDMTSKQFRGASLAISAQTAPSWSILPGVLELKGVFFALEVQRLLQRNGQVGTQLAGVIGGTFDIADELTVSARIPLPLNSTQWTISASSALEISLPQLARYVGGVDFNTLLPAGLATIGSFTLTRTCLTINPAGPALSQFALELFSTSAWIVVPQQVSIENCAIAVTIDNPFSDRLVTGYVEGTIAIGQADVAVRVSREIASGDWLLHVLADQIPLPSLVDIAGLIGADVTTILPASFASMSFLIYDLAIQLDLNTTRLLDISFQLQAEISCTYYLDNNGQGPSIVLDQVLLGLQKTPTTFIGFALATFQIAGVDIEVEAEYLNPGWQFQGSSTADEQILLSGLLRQLAQTFNDLPGTAPMELPDLSFSDISITIVSNGEFSVTARCTTEWELPFGVSGLSVSTVDFVLHRSSPVNNPQTGTQISCSLKLHSQGPVAIVEGLLFKSMDLSFDLNQQSKSWSLSGSISASVLNIDVTLAASLLETPMLRSITLKATEAPTAPVLSLGEIGSLGAKDITLTINKVLQSVSNATSGGVNFHPSSSYRWLVQITSDLVLTDVFALDGTLTLAETSSGVILAFMPTTAVLAFNLPEPLQVGTTHLGLEALSLVSTTDSLSNRVWSFDTTIDLWFSGFPPSIQSLMPSDTKKVRGVFHADSSKVQVTVDQLVPSDSFTLPITHVGSKTLDLGTVAVEVTHVQLELGQSIRLAATIGLGIPQALNALFGIKDDGTPAIEFFHTFDPSQPEASLIKIQFILSEQAISLTPQSSFIKALQTIQVSGMSWWNCDLGESGEFRFEVPVFSYNPASSSFTATGAFVIDKDKPLQIPLGPIKRMLGPLGNALPSGLPIRELNLLDLGKLNVDAFLQLLPTGQVADDLRKALTPIADVVGRLPDTFQQYLDITIPQNLSFSIEATPEGSVQLDVKADPQSPLKMLYPTVAPLPPSPVPMPVIFGFQLTSLSFGPLSGGSLFQLQVDAIIDQFDLLTLGAALLLPQDGSVPLPSSHDLQRRIIIEKLFMIIVYETVIPIPIPVFYTQLGLEYLGLEGVAVQAHARFPMPSASLKEAAQLFSGIERFFTDRSYLLPTDPAQAPKSLNLVFSLNKDFLQTPRYLSSKTLGIPNNGPSLNAYQTVATVLNCLKKLSLGELTFDEILQLIPLDNRVGHEQVTFGPLEFIADWLMTTPQEFQQGAYRQLAAYRNQTTTPMQDFKAVLPVPTNGSTPTQNLVIFLRGYAKLGSMAGLDGAFGVVASAKQGFHTGFSLAGRVADLLDAELSGQVALHLPDARTSLPAASAPPAQSTPSAPAARSDLLVFDGSSSFMEMAGLNIQPQAFTVECWLNPRSHHDYNQCLTATNGWGSFMFHTTETGAVYVGIDVPTRLTPHEIPDGTLTLNTWQHVAFTFDHGTGCFYRNGLLLATKSGMSTPQPWGGFRVGLPSTNTLDGQVADIRIWGRSLSVQEVQTGMYASLLGDEQGLLGCWLCQDGRPNTAADLTGHYPAILSRTTWAMMLGPLKLSGLAFDGQASYVDVPGLTWQPRGALTVEWWLNPRSHHDYTQCLAATSGWGAFMFHTTENGAVYVGIDVPTRLTPNELPAGTVVLNTWQHFAFTFDDGVGRFYKNGALLATKSGMNKPQPWGGFRVGQPSSNTIDGQVDELRVWGRALPGAEIQAHCLIRLNGNETGLQGYWRFDQETGATVRDGTGRNPASLVGTTWAEPPLVKLAGLIFDGQASYVDVPGLTWQPLGALTVEWWLNPRSHHDYTQCLAATSGWGAFMFHTTESGAVYVGIDVPTRLTPNELPAGTVVLNTWQHFAFTFDDGVGRFYKNGALLATKSGMNKPQPWGGFRVGQPSSNTIDGQLDELRIWSRALPGAEIQRYWRRQRSGTETGLYGYWRFGPGQSSLVTDLTPKAWPTILYDAHTLLPQVPATISTNVFQLKGRSHLSLLKELLFDGDLQITNESLWMNGQLTLFPNNTLITVGGNVQGWISKKAFYLAGEATAALAGLAFSQARVILSNKRIMLSGTCLGVTTTLDVSQQQQELIITGIIRPTLKVNVDLGKIVKGTTLLAQNAHVDLDAGAQLNVIIRQTGFSASVTAWSQYNGTNLSFGPFTLTVAPTDLAALADEIRKQIQVASSQFFLTLYPDARAWLQGIAEGAIQWASSASQDMGKTLRDGYGTDASAAALALKQAGYSADQVGSILQKDFTQDANVAARALQDAGFAAQESKSVLQKTFQTGVDKLDSSLKKLFNL